MNIHMCLCVKGVLKNWNKKQLRKLFFTKDDGKFASADEAKEYLLDELSKGHEVLPMGKCDNFDYKHGCKGHDENVIR